MFKIFTLSILLTIVSLADAPIFKTGLIQSYDADGNVPEEYGTIKDDGYYQKGISRVFTRRAPGVVEDSVTKLIWQDDYSDNALGIKLDYFSGAKAYCGTLALDGLGWRLPTKSELASLGYYRSQYPVMDSAFTQMLYGGQGKYWSSTESSIDDMDWAWSMEFEVGSTGWSIVIFEQNLVRCVKEGQVIKPSIFSRNENDNIVTDSTTGLEWQDNSETGWASRTWIESIDYCEDLTLGDYTDWRLPNINELKSIIGDPTGINSIFKTSYTHAYYWSSTSLASIPTAAYFVDYTSFGGEHFTNKIVPGLVRCVRSESTFSYNPAVIMYLLN